VVEPRRAVAGAALVAVVTGAVAVTVAVAAGPGLTGYVSEAGTATSRYAVAYRSGVCAVAGALLLLSVATAAAGRVRLTDPWSAGVRPVDRAEAGSRPARSVRSPVARWGAARWALRVLTARWAAPGLLAGGAVAGAVSGTVSCSARCPLPPFERATVADLVHGGASVLGVACCAFAMLAVAATAADPLARRCSAVAAGATFPLSALVASAMLGVGRGAVVGVLERLLLAVLVLWSAALAVVLTVPGGRPPPRLPVRSVTASGASSSGVVRRIVAPRPPDRSARGTPPVPSAGGPGRLGPRTRSTDERVVPTVDPARGHPAQPGRHGADVPVQRRS
jgi:hypothetical protein